MCLLEKAQLKAFGKTDHGGHSSSIPPLWSKEPLGGGHQHAVILNEALVRTTNSQKGTDIVGGSGCRPPTNSRELTL